MTIPFLDLFKKLTGKFGGGTAVVEVPERTAPRVVRPKKAEGERLSKTVLPNSTRSLSSTPDPFKSAATVAAPRSSMPLELGARKITTSAPTPRPSQLPPALARALEPKVERTISLRVSDVVDLVPPGYIKPVEILDTNATLSLKASEIEKGMPDKHPTISLPSLYQQVPEIFLRSVRPDDDTRIELPYQKVLAQFQNAHVRADQQRDPAVPHVDTPILTATIEDSKRFGTRIDPVETSTQPHVPVKHASAKSIADAEPDATPAQPKATVKITPSGQRVISLNSPELKSNKETPEASPTETKTTFELSPNGTGAFASERVPASSGPPVPTPLPFNPELAKIAFQLPKKEKAEATTSEEKSSAPSLAETPKQATKPISDEPFKLKLKIQPEKPVAGQAAEPAAGKPVDPITSIKGPIADSTQPAAVAKPPITETPKPAAAKQAGEGPFTLKLQLDPEKPVASKPSVPTTVDTPVVTARPLKPTIGEPVVPTKAPSPPVENLAIAAKIGPPRPVAVSMPEAVSTSPTDTSKISFSLKAVLQNLPAFQLSGDAASIPDDARFTLPLALVEPQLASGRVSVAPEVFQNALPEAHRGLFQLDVAKTAVALPLEEVLKNLPATVLKLRDDQETHTADKDFETPFFLKAQEDARRFAVKVDPAETKQPAVESKSEAVAPVETKPAAEKIDPKEIVTQANALDGVKACAITFSDGLSLAGELPEEVEADGLAAMAPSMLERIDQHVRETKLGQLVAMTLHASNSAVSFVARGNVCLTALHDKPLTPEVRNSLAGLVEKLSKTYAQPETPNVDH